MKYSCRIAVLVLAAASCAFPAGLSIGVASAVGSYSVDNAVAQGATELTDGSRLKTTIAPSRVMLANGVNVLQATRSSTRLYADHVVLEDGALRVGHFDQGFAVQVRGLAVESETPNSETIVRTRGNTVEVASLGGSVNVTDGGARLIRVAAGTKMSFAQDDQSSGSGQTQTGAKPVPPTASDADRNALLWSIVGIAGAAVVFGCVAGVEGKSPF
jgi:hypothetical protein